MISLKLWESFAARHPGHRHLERQTLLALTHPVIAAIVERTPDFFSDEDLSFEWDLAWTVPIGFQFQIPVDDRRYFDGLWDGAVRDESFDLPPLPTRLRQGPPRAATKADRLTPEINLAWAPDHQARRASQESMHGFLDMETTDGPWDESLQRRLESARIHEYKRFRRHTEGYVVWLATNSEYQDDRNRLRAKHSHVIVRERGFPRLRLRYPSIVEWSLVRPLENGVSPWGARAFGTEVMEDFREFYRKWSLDTMLTWEVPLPLELEACISDQRVWRPTSEEGLSLFLPWPILRRSDLDLDGIVARYRHLSAPPHLRPWLEKRSEGESGEIALQQQFQILWNLKLVLEDRYPEMLRGRVGLMDQVFEGLLGRAEGGDTVTKRRRSLSNALARARQNKAQSRLTKPSPMKSRPVIGKSGKGRTTTRKKSSKNPRRKPSEGGQSSTGYDA
jgi:hypothetical protein